MTDAVVMHVITGLDMGGAERMLVKLLTDTRHPSVVVSLRGEGVLGPQIKALGIPVHGLNLARNASIAKGISGLRQLIEQYRPAVIQSWLYAADLLAGYVAKKQGLPIVWNIRQSETRCRLDQWHISLNQRINARLSGRWPHSIVFCAHEALRCHQRIGYAAANAVVIPNGIDTDAFRPEPSSRHALRNQWARKGDVAATALVGIAGRYDPLKNHRRFLDVIAGLKSQSTAPFRAVMIGRGIESSNAALRAMIEQKGLQDDCHLLGERHDMNAIFNALDLVLLTSDSEGWPNVLGEAMAAGKPCVATDVGDVARVFGSTGKVVDVDDTGAFIKAVQQCLDTDEQQRKSMGAEARKRIVEHFSIAQTVKQYDGLYTSIINERASKCAA